MPFDFSKIDTGATAWVLASAALVLLMTPGLAFFYGGMVRAKHTLGMLMQNFMTIGIVSIVWVLVSFSLAFGKGNGFVGDLHFAGLQHLSEVLPGYTGPFAQVIPPMVFVVFQLMFAVITPALITGSTADRWKFGHFVPFIAIWSILVYGPVAHWVFSPEGWLFKKGALDFAGGTVVHINAGAAGLAMALLLGKRRGYPKEQMRPHNVPFVLLGASLLWFGWFGFNAGSALGANNLAAYAFVNTNTATAAAMVGWLLVEKLRDGKATTLGAASGAVTGLVAITPCAGFVSPLGSIAVGLLAGAICAYAILLKRKLGYDDSLDVVGVHLVGGIVGSLSVGLFSTLDTNTLGADGLFYGGGWKLMGHQLIAVGAVAGYSFVVTLIIGFGLKLFLRMRLTPDEEAEGMDLVLHGESAYEFGNITGGGGGLGSVGQRPESVSLGGPTAPTGVQA
ncbi:MAG: ammonium transporter, Amt family [Frankiaceae bacterium]|jgi:Amt family ammonium transporter|nr:ammonium transporter, Amt family [Frankiaceae bacterium]